jgi:hypothetical protein
MAVSMQARRRCTGGLSLSDGCERLRPMPRAPAAEPFVIPGRGVVLLVGDVVAPGGVVAVVVDPPAHRSGPRDRVGAQHGSAARGARRSRGHRRLPGFGGTGLHLPGAAEGATASGNGGGRWESEPFGRDGGCSAEADRACQGCGPRALRFAGGDLASSFTKGREGHADVADQASRCAGHAARPD